MSLIKDGGPCCGGGNELNRFLPNEEKVEISSIFNWFKADFEKAGGTKEVLAKHAPENARDFLASGDYEIIYLPYNWGLNDQGTQGNGYGRGHSLGPFRRFHDLLELTP